MSQLSTFYQAAQTLGFAKDNLLRLTSIGSEKLAEKQLIYLKTATLPARTVKTLKFNYRGFGLNVPSNANYNESANWRVTFYSDENYLIRDLLERWSRDTYNEADFSRMISTNDNIVFELYKYTLNEKFQITERGQGIEIKDERGNSDAFGGPELKPVRRYTLCGCFPVNLGSISYTITNAGAIASVEASFAYQYVISESI